MKKRIVCILSMLLIFTFSNSAFANEQLINLIKARIEKGDVWTLEQCIELAISNNPNISAARNTSKVLETKIGQSKANYYPKLNISTGVDRRNSSTNSSFDNTLNQAQGTISLNQYIYDFGKTSSNVKIQKYNYNSAVNDVDDTIVNIVYNVKKAYYDVLLAQKNREIQEKSVKQYEQLLKQAQAFYKQGMKSKIDVTIAETNLSNAKLSYIKADNAVKLAYANLNNAIGIPEVLNYAIEDNLVFKKYDISFETALETAFKNRPDLKSIADKKLAATETIKLQKKDYLPEITGSTSYGVGGLDFDFDPGWSIGANISIPVLNVALTKNKIKEAEYNLELTKSKEEMLKQNALLEVQEAYLSIIEAEKSIPVAEQTVKQAKENYDIAVGRYKNGVGNPIEVKDAELTYRNSELTRIKALYDYNIAVSNLERAMGTR